MLVHRARCVTPGVVPRNLIRTARPAGAASEARTNGARLGLFLCSTFDRLFLSYSCQYKVSDSFRDSKLVGRITTSVFHTVPLSGVVNKQSRDVSLCARG